jgi:uncharacterized protein YjgD (DUF1641 family)
MSEEYRDKIDEIYDLVKENNKILRSMHRKQVLGQIMTFFYWLVILGLAGWSYYMLKPYLDKYMSMYQNIMKTLNTMDTAGSDLSTGLQGLLEKVQ